ncbi:NAD(P)/FAD-dependent oxidoreductase [Actinoallomurus iriomotensis]|uniref:Pyridine nucleotide-disulfide oxidoreductase n=1 Tax=Actinoallomurus iriomotensis TaxID=478107 RepID=A0A9W6RGV4_9ACTN|nr:FAD-dependent oxidoreductase [Actinoallomurus iriomotensis]GLY75841.1 pyridine nucleotide-disulfide oxidoreductase [Actinoallomurus iriomotensis]
MVSVAGPSSVLVVGASAAGLCTAEALRRKGYTGRLTVLGDEPHLPYDRPPLSKQVLSGAWTPDRARLRTEDALAGLDAEFLLADPAIGLDPATRTVRTASGRTLRGEVVVVATGARPRELPGQAGLAGVHVLRTLDDALALRAGMAGSSRLVVVGDGVLGAEVAATARTLGLDVTLTGPRPAPMAGTLGPLVANLLAEVHAEHGVRLRMGGRVAALAGQDGTVTGVRLEDGEVLPADIVVVAIGADPATGWLGGSGLPLDDGLVCDSRCRAAEGIYAVGDVARRHDERLGGLVRLENRTNAAEQARVVAANILGADLSYSPVPYFWTDQFAAKLQIHGTLPTHADADVTVVDGDLAGRRFVARYSHAGRVTGVLGWNMPKQTRLRRQELLETHTDRTSRSVLTPTAVPGGDDAPDLRSGHRAGRPPVLSHGPGGGLPVRPAS